MRIVLTALLLAIPAFGNSTSLPYLTGLGFFIEAPAPAHGFVFQLAQQESFTINGWGPNSLPSYSKPFFNPNMVLSLIGGNGTFAKRGSEHFYPVLYYSGAITITGSPFKLWPNQPVISHPVFFFGHVFACLVAPCNASHAIASVLVDTPGSVLIKRGVGERLTVMPEPGTWILLGTGLSLLAYKYRRFATNS